jgi:hypothetical protein
VSGPQDYDEVAEMPLTDVLNRFQVLEHRDSTARSIAILKARGTYRPGGHVTEDRFPPLTVDEHLELIALGEALARHFRHPASVHDAVLAGATWEQIAAAAGSGPDQARQAYREWAEGQHRLRQDYPGGTIGLGGEQYAAALEAAGEPAAAAEDTRRLDAIRGLLARFDWERDDRQLALEAIDRIAEGGQA